MPNLLQATKFQNRVKVMDKEEHTLVEGFNNMIKLYMDSLTLIGHVNDFKDRIDSKIVNESFEIRKNTWINERKLPELLTRIPSCDGGYSDVLTALNYLPKVKLSEYRTLADVFNMVIIPIEYTEINKLFDSQDNSKELKNGLSYFINLLKQDVTTQYQCYILCPIDYYNIWEQIKSDIVVDIYYSDYFDSVFQTLNLLIPIQKNLYMATQTNDENLKSLAQTFDTNIKILNTNLTSLSNKIDKLERESIKIKQEQSFLQEQNMQLQETVIKQQAEINYLYCKLDPILFAVPKNTNVIMDEVTSIVGLCWGSDIDEIIFKMKNVAINHKVFEKIDPLNIEKIMFNEGFTLDNTRSFDKYQYIYQIILQEIPALNKKRFKEFWISKPNYLDNIYKLPINELGIVLIFNYDWQCTPSKIMSIAVEGLDGFKKYYEYVKFFDLMNETDHCTKYNIDDNHTFLKVYQRPFNELIKKLKKSFK